jgi:hypothetical protein
MFPAFEEDKAIEAVGMVGQTQVNKITFLFLSILKFFPNRKTDTSCGWCRYNLKIRKN